MTVKYIDAHCHLQFDQYAHDREEIAKEMKEKGVAGIVVGCDLATSRTAIALAEKHEHLYASIGLHPNNEGDEVFEPAQYRELARSPKVVALGECGLDFFRPEALTDALKQKQRSLFKEHITLATELNKPLVIHARPSKGTEDAYLDLIELLREAKKTHPSLSGDIHFFVGSVQSAAALQAIGFTVSFTAVITFAREYDAVISAAPLGSILSETDAPYVAPLGRRGKRNDPLSVIEVVTKIAEIRGEDREAVRMALLENTRRIFALPLPKEAAPSLRAPK